MDDEDCIRRHGGNEVALQAHLPHLLVSEDADDDGVGALGDAGQIRYRLCAQFLDSLPLFRCATKRTDLVTGVDQSAHHGCAHAPRPDEADPGHRGCSIDIQRGVGRIEHRALRRRRAVGKARGMPDVLLQQCPCDGRHLVEGASEGGNAADRPAVRRPAGDDFAQSVAGNAKGLAQFDGADRGAQVGGEEHVVQDFGNLAAAERAQVDDGVGVGREHRATAVDDVGVAAGHDQQLALFDGGRPAAHRGVDDRNTLFGSRLGEFPARVGMDGAVDRDDAARRQPGEDPGVTVEHFSDIVVADDAHADQVAGGRQLGG